jgi:hypothetical protein
MKSDPNKQVIVTEDGETIQHAEGPDLPRVPAENIEGPTHDWRSKAFEQFTVSQRRRKIVRRLLKERKLLSEEHKDYMLRLNEVRRIVK